MRKLLRFEIITKMERNHAIKLVSDAIVSHEGWVVDHQLFSNVSATIRFEMPGNEVSGLVDLLSEQGLKARLEDAMPESSNKDIQATIAFTFIHDEPDMKRDVPAFG